MVKNTDDSYFMIIQQLIDDITPDTIIEKDTNCEDILFAHVIYGIGINDGEVILYKQRNHIFIWKYYIRIGKYKLCMSQNKAKKLFHIFEKKYSEIGDIVNEKLRIIELYKLNKPFTGKH